MTLRNPVGLAHVTATPDRLSGGRLVLGIGTGGDVPEGFEASGIPLGERGPRCDEALEIIKSLWTGDPVNHNGDFYKFRNYSLGATPLQNLTHPSGLVGLQKVF